MFKPKIKIWMTLLIALLSACATTNDTMSSSKPTTKFRDYDAVKEVMTTKEVKKAMSSALSNSKANEVHLNLYMTVYPDGSADIVSLTTQPPASEEVVNKLMQIISTIDFGKSEAEATTLRYHMKVSPTGQ